MNHLILNRKHFEEVIFIFHLKLLPFLGNAVQLEIRNPLRVS